MGVVTPWEQELCPRWTHREDEAVILEDGSVLLKLKVHERDASGGPRTVSIVRALNRVDGSTDPDYWGDPACKATLAEVLGVAHLDERLVFPMRDVAAAVRSLNRIRLKLLMSSTILDLPVEATA